MISALPTSSFTTRVTGTTREGGTGSVGNPDRVRTLGLAAPQATRDQPRATPARPGRLGEKAATPERGATPAIAATPERVAAVERPDTWFSRGIV